MSDRKSLLVGGALLVLLAVAWPAAQERGVSTQDGLFPVSIAADSPYRPAVEADARFRIVGDDARLVGGQAVMHVGADTAQVEETQRGRAAWQALRQATAVWVESRMPSEADQAAAYPVRITLLSPNALAAQEGGGAIEPGEGAGEAAPTDGSVADSLAEATGATGEAGLQPGQLEPPFPVRSLLLTFAYLIPMNFIAQLQAGTLHAERIRHRATILLSAPVPHWQVLLGRMTPYIALSAGAWLAASALIGSGASGILAAAVIVAFVLVGATAIGLLARSEREVTFLLTGLTTAFSTFLFLPAVFTAIEPIAFLSPVSVIARSIDGTAVAWSSFLYAILPTAMCTAAIALLCVGLFREETLFSRRGLVQKSSLGLMRLVPNPLALGVAAVLLVPFALALELFVLGLVIPLGLLAAFPAVIVGAAAVDEGLKSMASRAYRARTGAPAWLAGLTVGVGFFLGQKIALLVLLAGFGALPLGQATLAILGLDPRFLFLDLLLVHVACGMLGAIQGKPGSWGGKLGRFGAFALHASYNVGIAIVAGMVL